MITSASNKQLKRITKLLSSARERRAEGLFVAEGWKLFRETPTKLRREVYVSETFAGARGEELAELDVPFETVEDRLFEKISDAKTPQGILTVAAMPRWTTREMLNAPRPLILMLENVQDPGNVGTMLRTAEGAGATGVLLSETCADLFSPKVVRATMGSVYRVPFCYVADLTGEAKALRDAGVTLCAAHLRGTTDFRKADYSGPAAILIGNEGRGLTDELADCAQLRVKIPMRGRVESLNAAVAAALLLYQAQEEVC